MCTNKNPYWYLGANATADLLILCKTPEGLFIKMVKRADFPGNAEGGKWALPGGFVDTKTKRGEEWNPSLSEDPQDAAFREAREETGLDLSNSDVYSIGIYEGNGRDPRDNNVSWSKSHAYLVVVDTLLKTVPQEGEISQTSWVDLSKIDEMEIAFDHKKIIQDGLNVYSALIKKTHSIGM